MALKTTRWRPDTCECVIDFTWDSDQPEASRTHTFSGFERQCALHVGHVDWSSVQEENQRKNVAVGLAATHRGTPGNSDGVAWGFTADRTLQIAVQGMSAGQKGSLQSDADRDVGGGRVEVL